MSYIKEPDGVDFVIAPSPYTDEDRDAISAHLREYQSKTKAQHVNLRKMEKGSKYSKEKTLQ